MGCKILGTHAKEAGMGVKAQSRTQRWYAAASRAVEALEELAGMQEEYGEWEANLPENLQNSALGEKLQTVANIDIANALDAAQQAADCDLPLGFGRD